MTAILHTRKGSENGAKPSDNSEKSRSDRETVASSVVRQEISGLKKPSHRHHETRSDRAILAAATGYLEKAFEKKTVFITVESHDQDERTARDLFRKVKSDISQLQARAGFPKFCVEVLEAACGVHSHLIAVLPLKIAKRLEGYSYGVNISKKGVVAVYDMEGLRIYLQKEVLKPTPKPLGEGGGDRVRLSKALKAALVEQGVMPSDYSRSYASRALKPVPMVPVVEAAVPSPQPASHVPAPCDPKQVELFPELPPPVSIISLLEETRLSMKLPQRIVASNIGVKQSHYANALRGHDGFGKDVRRNAWTWLAKHGFPRPPEGPHPPDLF